MKGKALLKLATDQMVLHLRELVGSIVLCILTFFLLALLLLIFEVNNNVRGKLEDSLQGGCDRIGYLQRNGWNEGRDLEDFLMSLDCVEAAGTWGYYGSTVDALLFLKEIQKNHVVMENNLNDECIENIVMSMSGWDMFQLELYEGERPEQYDINKYTLLYLGYEFRDTVEVGTILTSETYKDTFIVAGILKKGVTMPMENLSSINLYCISSTYPMDYGVIEVIPFPIGAPAYFSVKDGYSFSEAQEAIQQAAKEKGWSVTVGSLGAVLDVTEAQLKPVKSYLMQMIIVVGLTVCIVFSCYQTISILVRKSEYGILYANGATTKDMIWIVLIENAVKVFIAMLLLLPLFLIIAHQVFGLYYGDQYMIQWIIWEKIIWKMVLIGVGIVLLSSGIPIYTIKKYPPVTLIRGGNIL